ncbi:hypothetical protein C8Q70DRAFT_1036339 [Cubamyces menziesii]|nr:hypothetical protein C8Q70DRAFT_1036339 [Cubamyces menziesii]
MSTRRLDVFDLQRSHTQRSVTHGFGSTATWVVLCAFYLRRFCSHVVYWAAYSVTLVLVLVRSPSLSAPAFSDLYL